MEIKEYDLWNKFTKSGSINDYLRYVFYKKGYDERLDNGYYLKWNSNKRSEYGREEQNYSHFDR